MVGAIEGELLSQAESGGWHLWWESGRAASVILDDGRGRVGGTG